MIQVFLKDGSCREFSKEVHGDNFEDLAKQFIETNKQFVIETPKSTAEETVEMGAEEVEPKKKGGRPKKTE